MIRCYLGNSNLSPERHRRDRDKELSIPAGMATKNVNKKKIWLATIKVCKGNAKKNNVVVTCIEGLINGLLWNIRI